MKCKPKTRTIGEVIGVIKANLGSEYVCEANMLGGKAVLLCFEQYYFRCSNYVSLSIMLTETEECQEVVVAGYIAKNRDLGASYGNGIRCNAVYS